MKRLLFLGLLAAFSFEFASAQVTARAYAGPTQNPKTRTSAARPKPAPPQSAQATAHSAGTGEVYIGYSGTAVPISSGGGFRGSERRVSHGVQTSVILNVSRLLGVKGDFSAGYSDRREVFAVIGRRTEATRRTAVYNILGGLQLKDNESEAFVQPFGHALVGVGIYRQSFRNCRTNDAPGTFCGTRVRDYGLAGAFGGGFDLRVTSRAGIRLTSDYNPMRIEGDTIHNFRFGAGVVFK